MSKFLFEIDAAVSRYKLTDYDNLLLLKQQLSGRAMYLINSLETNNQNYTEAVNLLKRAFKFGYFNFGSNNNTYKNNLNDRFVLQMLQ